MHVRIAKEFERIEEKFGGKNKLSYDTIYELLQHFNYVVPQGSPMMGIGNNYVNVSLSNCVVIDSPKDNISSIVDSGKHLANLFNQECLWAWPSTILGSLEKLPLRHIHGI